MKNPNTENWLEKKGKNHPYTVPEHYFEDFQARMEMLYKTSDEDKVVERNVWMRAKPYVALAASFLLLVAAGAYILEWVTPGNNAPNNPELSDQELYGYYFDIIPRSDPDAIFYAEETGADYVYIENEE